MVGVSSWSIVSCLTCITVASHTVASVGSGKFGIYVIVDSTPGAVSVHTGNSGGLCSTINGGSCPCFLFSLNSPKILGLRNTNFRSQTSSSLLMVRGMSDSMVVQTRSLHTTNACLWKILHKT